MPTPAPERLDGPGNVDAVAAALDEEIVASVARAALEVPDAALVAWTHERIPAGIGDATAGAFRVTGTARVGGEARPRPWSAVLKVLHPGWAADAGQRAARAAADPAHWRNWRREALVYESGAVAKVPGGFVPARCLRVDFVGERLGLLWLEEVRSDDPQPWPAARLRLAARHLGRFQSAFAVGRPLPEAPWFPRDWLRRYVEDCAPFVAWARANEGHALADRLWPPDVREGVLRVWEERGALLDALDALPQTVRHGDANVGNLFARRGAAGDPETAAVDWELAARGAVGEDLFALLRARTRVREELPPDALRDLVFGGYADGLRDAGWRGDEDAVRLGHAAGAALRDCFHTMLYELVAEGREAEAEGREAEAQARGGFTFERLAEGGGHRVRAALEHARVARELLGLI